MSFQVRQLHIAGPEAREIRVAIEKHNMRLQHDAMPVLDVLRNAADLERHSGELIAAARLKLPPSKHRIREAMETDAMQRLMRAERLDALAEQRGKAEGA